MAIHKTLEKAEHVLEEKLRLRRKGAAEKVSGKRGTASEERLGEHLKKTLDKVAEQNVQWYREHPGGKKSDDRQKEPGKKSQEGKNTAA